MMLSLCAASHCAGSTQFAELAMLFAWLQQLEKAGWNPYMTLQQVEFAYVANRS